MARLLFVRLLPVVLIVAAFAFWIFDVQQGGEDAWRNLVPPAVLLVLCAITLRRGDGTWTGAGWRWPLGALGYAIPALGLSAYLHYAWSVNLNDMFSDPADPGLLFRYLPIYTFVAGAIGFAIGWIAGRNL